MIADIVVLGWKLKRYIESLCTDAEWQQEDQKCKSNGCMKETGEQEENEERKKKGG